MEIIQGPRLARAQRAAHVQPFEERPRIAPRVIDEIGKAQRSLLRQGELFERAFQERRPDGNFRQQPPLFAAPFRNAELRKARVHRFGGFRHLVDRLAGGVFEARFELVHAHRAHGDDGRQREAGKPERDDGGDPAAHARAPPSLICAFLAALFARFRLLRPLPFLRFAAACGLSKALLLLPLFEALCLLLLLRLL